MLLISDM